MKKNLFILMLCLTLIVPMVTNVVMVNGLELGQIYTEKDIVKEARKDIIEYRFRNYRGVDQYRRWNTTRNRWVDATWKNLK